jgi:Ca2+-binding RTX toxin-like protein
MGDGDDFVDLTAHGPGGVDYTLSVTINGDAGNDILIGGAGKDTIRGDSGNDLIFGWRGSDTIDGGDGDDTLYGDDFGFNNIGGDDIVRGGNGNDTLYGGLKSDRLEGGNDNDTAYGGAGGDTILGEMGDDILFGEDNNDIIGGGQGNDQLDGGNGADELNGGDGNDTLDGAGGALDFMAGDAGDDRLIAGVGNDTLDGGVDIDTAVFGGNLADYTITLNPDGSYNVLDDRASSPDGLDLLRNIEFFEFADQTIPPPGGGGNAPPTITSNGGGSTAAISVDENTVAVTTVTATDPDVGQTVTYSISGGADANKFTIDANTGVLVFINAPDWENPTDVGGNNVYDVIVRASDGNGGLDTQAIAVTINNLPDTGQSPTITSDGGGATASISLAENTAAVTTVTATDPDSPIITFSITGGADATRFAIDQNTGVLTFIAAPDFEAPSDAGGNNVYDVVVRASDGFNFDEQAIAVTVTNANDIAPIITSNGGGASAAISLAENSTAVTTVTATDGDGTTPTYRIAGGADAAFFSIDENTGALIFVAAPDFENPADAGADNVYDVIVEAIDGLNADQQALAITVTDVNEGGGVTITGTSGNDVISPTQTNPAFRSTALNDTIFGLDGADSIDGGAGADTMEGGLGNDSYFVDVFSDDGSTANDDLVIELAGGGVDLVTASVSYILPTEVENLTLGNAGAINGVGNALANTIVGNNDNNILSGGDANDTLRGNDGADTLNGDAGNDNLFGGNGADQIFGGANIDVLEGGELDDFLDGGAAGDTLRGQSGNDIILGGNGKDTMFGGTENDTFQFNPFDSALSASAIDIINDFTSGSDKIDFSWVTGPLGPSAYAETTIASSLFADALAAANAQMAAGRVAVFVAGTVDGWLFWDQDGNGAIDQAALMKSLTTVAGFDLLDII